MSVFVSRIFLLLWERCMDIKTFYGLPVAVIVFSVALI